jgi:TolA-binding protein
MNDPIADDIERRRQHQLLQQQRLEEDEDEEEELRRRRSQSTGATSGARPHADDSSSPRPNWLTRPKPAPEPGRAGPTATAEATGATKAAGRQGGSKLVMAGGVLALAAGLAWWTAHAKSSPTKDRTAAFDAMAMVVDRPVAASAAALGVSVAASTTKTAVDNPPSGSANTNATTGQAAPTTEFEIDASDWQALMDSAKRTEGRLGGIEGELVSIKDVLAKLQGQVDRLPTAAARPQQVGNAQSARPRPTRVAIGTNTSRAAPAPPPIVAAPTPSAQLLAVDIWDGKPSVVMQGPEDNGRKALRFLAVGDRTGTVTLRSADPRSQQAVFELPGGEMIIERDER